MTPQRTDNFVPLTIAPPAGENREFRVKVIPQTGPAHSFKTLEQAAFKPGESAPATGGKNCEPCLSLQRDGGRITSIHIQCSCGQIMDLACVYDEPPKVS
jgi:hypothetical protein